MVIYLIRHAQTLHNKKGKVFSGVSDVLLSSEGEKEALRWKNSPLFENVRRVYITPLKRTHQTADFIFDKSIERIVIPSLEEMNFGEYEGRVLDEESETDPVFRLWMNDPESLVFPSGDSFKEHAEEAFSAFKEIAENETAEEIAIVSHRTTIRLILTQLLGRSLGTFRDVPCDNCSAAKIIYKDGKFEIVNMNIKAE